MYKFINLNSEESEPLYIQLYLILKDKIIEKELKAHSKLPPIRKLAKEINVTNNTIIKAYDLLEQEKYVYKKIGSGTYIYDIDETNETMATGFVEYSSDMINLGSGTPSEELFPSEAFKEAINYVLDRYKGRAFGYTNSKGDEQLILAIYNKFVKGKFDVPKKCVQIVSGAQQGIDIVSKALLSENDYVMIESPTYTGAIAIFKSRGCQFTTINIDYSGIDFEVFEKRIKRYRPKLFFSMPNFHNPTGYTYTKEERIKVLELAEKYDFYIIEDDYASELNFSDEEIITLKAFDTKDRVIYIKSFSKVFLPGLRLGYLIAPEKLETKITMAKHTTDISTSSLLQKSFNIFLENNKWEEQAEKIYELFNEAYDITIKIFENYLPKEVILEKPLGGINFWLKFPETVNIEELYEYLLMKNIIIAPGIAFYVSNKKTNYIRISIASIEKDKLELNLMEFCNKVDEFLNNRRGLMPIL